MKKETIFRRPQKTNYQKCKHSEYMKYSFHVVNLVYMYICIRLIGMSIEVRIEEHEKAKTTIVWTAVEHRMRSTILITIRCEY